MSTAPASPSSRLATLPEGVPEYTLGWEAVLWASKYLRHPNGPRAGERWQFIDSQLRFLLWFYAVDDQGRWLYNHAVRRLAKGSGKSPFAAVMAMIEFCAPVRVAYFDPALPGGVKGKPVDMPLVQIAATAESQTANTMRMVRALCQKGSRVAIDHNIDVGKTQFYRLPEGSLEVITSSAEAAEGAEATFVVADETEHWQSKEGTDLHSTLTDNLGKSDNRMIETCNSWVPGSNSIAEDSWDAWVAQEEGRTNASVRTLYDARVAPPDTDLDDLDSLTGALKWVYDDCFWAPLESIAQRILGRKNRAGDNERRKYLNQPTAVANAWVTQQDWLRLADPRDVPAGDAIVLFFDGSKSRDATALVACRLEDGYTWVVGAWEPNRDGYNVPAHEVDAVVARAFDTWDVWAFFADVREFESFVKVSWPEQYGEGLRLWAQPSGKDTQPIAWDMRTRTFEFTKAVELVEQEIYGEAFRHDGSEVMQRHVENARRKLNRYGYSIGKESPASTLKVDVAVAMVGARMVRQLVINSDAWKRTKDRIKGVLVLT